jgi:hypothetical protein
MTKSFYGVWILFLAVCFSGMNSGCGKRKIDYDHPLAKLTAVTLFAEYKADGVKAQDKYIGNVVELSGIVDRVGTDSANRPYIAFKGDESGDVQCFFARKYEKDAALLKKGDSVTVCGVMLSRVINVTLDSCIIIKKG